MGCENFRGCFFQIDILNDINFESEKIVIQISENYFVSKEKKKGETIFICLKYKLIFIFTLWNEVDTIQLTQLTRIILYFISNLRGRRKNRQKNFKRTREIKHFRDKHFI